MDDQNTRQSKFYLEALEFHSQGKKGKIGIDMIKPLRDRKDLSLAYSPGVGAPCLEIHKDPSKVFEYTSKGNFVAVISNGTAVLGLGNLGALASKPVMEGKAVLFKRFADIDSIDIEVDTSDPEKFINCVRYLAPSWGGINLEDIKAPECFVIERELEKLVDIPVFHDDQHGTAIIVSAGLINACHITSKQLKDLKIVVNGAGAAALSCIELLIAIGASQNNIILCDSQGVIYKGRKENMNEWKEPYASATDKRNLAQALEGADMFLGLSVKGAVSKEMISSMAPQPIIFALANPDPEITPEDITAVRSDAIIATGRSDYSNQINNVLCFPYIFRGALDVHATTINKEMKLAAIYAIANLARKHITEEISSVYSGAKREFGTDYIIPVPFDSRLIQEVPVAVAQAAMETGVARKPIEDLQLYRQSLAARLDPTVKVMDKFFTNLREDPKQVIFAMGENKRMIEAAVQWCTYGYGKAILIGKASKIELSLESFGIKNSPNIAIIDPKEHNKIEIYTEHLYKRLQRKGFTAEECKRLLLQNHAVFATEMLIHKEADAAVAGLEQGYLSTMNSISMVAERQHDILFALSALVKKDKVLFLADTAINESPSAQELAEIAIISAKKVQTLGYEARVAFLSFSNFGTLDRKSSKRIQEAVAIMESKNVDFEYDGEMTANVALNEALLKNYPFSRLSAPANILIMPTLHSAHISSKLLQEFGEAKNIGPILCGLSEPVQIVQMSASASEIINAAAIAASNKESF